MEILDANALRQDLEKSIASDTHLSLRKAANSLPGSDALGSQDPKGIASPLQLDTNDAGKKSDTEEGRAEENANEKDPESEDYHGEGDALTGMKVKKKFGRKYYHGIVLGFDPETHWYKVEYEDGDEEELWWRELEPLLVQSLPESASKAEGEHKVHRKRTRSEQISTEVVKQEQEKLEEVSTPVASEDTAMDRKKTKVSGKRGKKRKLRAEKSASEETDEDIEKTQTSGKRGKKRTLQAEKENLSTANKRSRVEETPADSAIRCLRSRTSLESGQGWYLIGRDVRKKFGGAVFTGRIIDFDPLAKYYKVSYEDGDEEELDWNELKPTLVAIDERVPSSSNDNVDSKPAKLSTPQTTKVVARQKPSEDSSDRGGAEDHRNTENKSARLERQIEVDRSPRKYSGRLHPALQASRYSSAYDAENLEFFAWGEVVAFDKVKCPKLQAVTMLPSSSPIVHLAASQHHLAALTAAGQVWVWRNKHGNIQERCSNWEHIPDLDNKSIVLVDIAGPDLDRSLAGYAPNQEDQVPDPFYLVAVSYGGKDYILQGSQPQEPVHAYSLLEESQHLSLGELLRLNEVPMENIGRVVQVSVGTVDAPDEPPFVGYITDSDRVFIRSATKDFIMEEVNHVTGFSGKPLKIQCGRAYHAIIMTDDGRAWTWGRPSNTTPCSTGPGSPFSVCQPAPAALAGRKVIDVGCCGEDFVALTDDGDVHQWTHEVSTKEPVTSVSKVATEDRLKNIALGVGLSAGISSSDRIHTWRTFPGVAEKATSTPSGRDEKSKDTTIAALGTTSILKILCVAGSLIVVGQKRRGRKKKQESLAADASEGPTSK